MDVGGQTLLAKICYPACARPLSILNDQSSLDDTQWKR